MKGHGPGGLALDEEPPLVLGRREDDAALQLELGMGTNQNLEVLTALGTQQGEGPRRGTEAVVQAGPRAPVELGQERQDRACVDLPDVADLGRIRRQERREGLAPVGPALRDRSHLSQHLVLVEEPVGGFDTGLPEGLELESVFLRSRERQEQHGPQLE